jgi:hypothetical protein
MGTPSSRYDFSTWTRYAPAFAALNASLGVYFNIATASIIANALTN